MKSANFTLNLYGPRRLHHDLIAQIIQEKGLSDIVFLRGEISGIQKENLLLDSDLFVLTSRFEGHPMGLIEALAYGVPAIVTPGSNMSREIQGSDAGWACIDASVAEISKTLEQILSERDRFSIKSKNAKELALLYDWDRLAIRFQENVSKLIEC